MELLFLLTILGRVMANFGCGRAAPRDVTTGASGPVRLSW
jgi:hypothetical protein